MAIEVNVCQGGAERVDRTNNLENSGFEIKPLDCTNVISVPEIVSIEKNDQKLSHSHHILMVEDNVLNQKIIALAFKKLGLDFDQAFNGKEALDFINDKNKSYSIIFLDYEMPVMNGLEALKEMVSLNIDSLIFIQSATPNIETIFSDFKERVHFLNGKLNSKEQIQDCLKMYEKYIKKNDDNGSQSLRVSGETQTDFKKGSEYRLCVTEGM